MVRTNEKQPVSRNMWQALRSDLKEFVAVVTDPNASKDDEYEGNEELSPAQEEVMRRMALEETFTQPLIDEEEASQKDNVSMDASDAEELEAARDQIQEYIESFDITAYEEEIAKCLDTYGDVLQPMLQKLVPATVSRKDFWMRYFYHCSVERIQQEIVEQENKERLERVTQSIQGVKSFLGGAVMSVASSMLENDEGGTPGVSPFHMNSGRRPPFVMNTAVDEDDEGENEELGWSDDEEIDDEAEAQIEFKDAATELLQEQLKQALEERDMLHETIELQKKQIADLTRHQSASVSSTELDIVEQLKMELFEKDAELAALRSKDELISAQSPVDEHPDAVDMLKALEKENEDLKRALASAKVPADSGVDANLAALEAENVKLKARLEAVELQLVEAKASAGLGSDDAHQKAKALEQCNSELKIVLDGKQSEMESMQKSMQKDMDELCELVSNLEAEKMKLNSTVDRLESEMTRLRLGHEEYAANHGAQVNALMQENSDLRRAVEAKNIELAEFRQHSDSVSKQMDSSCGESAASPESVVKVEVEQPPKPKEDVQKVDDGSDDWGDDWGDEDE